MEPTDVDALIASLTTTVLNCKNTIMHQQMLLWAMWNYLREAPGTQEARLIELLNAERASYGLPPLEGESLTAMLRDALRTFEGERH